MPCGCKKKSVIDTRPDEACVYCAHKHIATARALYSLETGYRDINKSDAIGQLILAAWHYQTNHFDMAMKCRDCWLAIERQKDAGEELRALQESAWNLVMEEDKKATAQGS